METNNSFLLLGCQEIVSTLPIRNGNLPPSLDSFVRIRREYLTYKEWKRSAGLGSSVSSTSSEYLTYKEWKLDEPCNNIWVLSEDSEYLTYKEWKQHICSKIFFDSFNECEYLTYKEWKLGHLGLQYMSNHHSEYLTYKEWKLNLTDSYVALCGSCDTLVSTLPIRNGNYFDI